MRTFTTIFKRFKLGRSLAILCISATLLLTTACDAGRLQGSARPQNPPVQMGGNNNSYSDGGDEAAISGAVADPKRSNPSNLKGAAAGKVSSNDKLDRRMSSQMASKPNSKMNAQPDGDRVASNVIKSNASDLLYPGDNRTETSTPDIGTKPEAMRPAEFPAKRQRVIDRSNPNERILEKVGQQFKDASRFLDSGLDAATEQ